MHSIGSAFSPPRQLPLSHQVLQGGPSADQPAQSFSDLLSGGVMEVNALQQDAGAQVHELLTGGEVNQTEVFTAVQKADMAFRMLVQVRNKLMSAYEEINSIRI